MTPFEQNMGDMVRESNAPEAKKSLAMNYVRATGKIANGSKSCIEALSEAIVAQTPILLELYLQIFPTLAEVAALIEAHAAHCKLNKEHKESIVRLRRDEGGEDMPFNWKRLLFEFGARMGWPAAVVIISIIYRSEIVKLLGV